MAIQFKNLVDVFEQRTGAIATDAYTLTVSTEQTSGATPNPGTGGLKVQYYSVSSGTTHGFGLVAGSSSSDFLTSGPMHFYTNSDLDTNNATGLAMVIDSSQNVGIGTTSPTGDLHVKARASDGYTDIVLQDSNTGGFYGQHISFQNWVGLEAASISVNSNPAAAELKLQYGVSGVTDVGEFRISSGNFSFRKNATNVMLIQSDTNVNIGMSSPAVNKLDVAGDIGINESIIHNGDTNTKFGFVANNNFAINTAGAERVRVTSGGNVGIGTSSPNTALEVDGAITTTTSDYVQGSTGSRLILETSGSGNTNSYIQAQSSGGTSSAEDLALQLFGGNVGIGTASPSEKLDVAGNVGIDESIIHNGDTDTKIGFVANDNFAITTAGVERVRVTSGGSVGIATNNPGAKLDVEGNAVLGSSGNTATGSYAVALNQNNTASALDSLATGENTTASGRQAFSGGFNTTASGDASFAVGARTTASAYQSFAAGAETNATGIASAAFNALTDATGKNSFAIGGDTTASGESSFSLGVGGNAQGLGSISAGLSCNTGGSANGAFAGGTASNANGQYSIAFGDVANASGRVSQALGYIVNATGQYSFAANFNNTASGQASAAFGQQNTVSGTQSIASGFLNTERNGASATFGSFNGQQAHSVSNNQFMFGRYLNVPRNSSGTPSQGCMVVGEHNTYLNRTDVKFAVGTGAGVGAEADSFTVLKDGNVLMEQIVNKNYSSDSAAASGGVPVGGIYHNSGDLKIRLT